jgi:undecaprenyl-diphosphatase
MNILIFVQIFYELLPVSSSGHVALYNLLYPAITPLTFFEDICAHIPTLLIIVLFFYQTCISWFFYHSHKRKLKDVAILLVCVCAGACGIGIKKIISQYTSLSIPLWYGFLCTSFLLIYSYDLLLRKNEREYLEFKDVGYLAFSQLFALIPGVSRFMITISTCLFLGMSKRYSLCVTFATECLLILGGLVLSVLLFFIKGSCAINFVSIDLFFIFSIGLISLLLFSTVIYMYKKNTLWLIAFYEIFITIVTFSIAFNS